MEHSRLNSHQRRKLLEANLEPLPTAVPPTFRLSPDGSAALVFFLLARASLPPYTQPYPVLPIDTSEPPAQHAAPTPSLPPVVHTVHSPVGAPAQGLGGHAGDLCARLLRGGGTPEALRRAAAADGGRRRRHQPGHSAMRRWERGFGLGSGRGGGWECWRSAERPE